jgi:uncharacterized membrane protein YgcG
MKQIFIALIIFMLSISSFAQERILDYNIVIDIEGSGDLIINEKIAVVVEGISIRRGIYRTFPTRYKDRLGNRFNVDFEVLQVLRNGEPEPWFINKRSNGIDVNTGDDSFIPHGIHEFTLTFRTTRQLGFFSDFDELYFNAIGGGWAFVIENAEVRVNLPPGASHKQYIAFSGFAGSTTCDCIIEVSGNSVIFKTTRPLEPGQQFTTVVSWPKGFVTEPTASQKFNWFLKDNKNVLVAFWGFLLVFVLYFRNWRKYGVDPPKGTIIPLFDPPAGFTPSEISYIQKMGLTQRAITATIVSMAIKGFLKIEQTKVLFSRKYSLVKVSENTDNLTPLEKAAGRTLFSGTNIVELTNKNHQLFQNLKMVLDRTLKKKLKPKYFSLNLKHLVPGFLASILLVVVVAVLSPSPLVPILLAFLLVLLGVLFVYLIKAPTPEGRSVMDDIEGFKMYVATAESEMLNHQHPPDITLERYEALLPYAMAIGVENQWSKKFENQLAKSLQDTSSSYNPAWYTGANVAAFSPTSFSSSFSNSFSSAISSSSSPPGSSSGSGGGGSAGGGGGGGGGGGR